jgi:hypothetical protein
MVEQLGTGLLQRCNNTVPSGRNWLWAKIFASTEGSGADGTNTMRVGTNGAVLR